MFTALSAAQRAAELISPYRGMKDFITHRDILGFNAHDFVTSSLFGMNSVAYKASESIRMLEALNDSLSLQKQYHKLSYLMSGFQKQHEISQSFQRILEPIPGFDVIKESIAARVAVGLREFEETQRVWNQHSSRNINDKVLAMANLNSLQQSIGFNTSSIQQAMKAMQQMRIFEESESLVNTVQQMQSLGVIAKSMQALNQHGIFAQAVESFNGRTYIEQFETEISDIELSEAQTLLGSSGDSGFLEAFNKLHPKIQAFILFLFLQIFMPQVNEFIFKPLIQNVLFANKLNTDEIRTLKKAPLQDIYTENLRFTTRNGVKVRARPNTRSEVLDELGVGQILTVINKKKSWAEVAYLVDGETCNGWILTTYTAKFKK